MLRLAGREADGAILNWLAAYDVAQCLRRGRQPGRRGRGADLRLPDRRRRVRPQRSAELLISTYLTVPAYAAFHDWLGRGDALRPMHEAWAAGDRQGRGRGGARRGRRRPGPARHARALPRAGAGLRRGRRHARRSIALLPTPEPRPARRSTSPTRLGEWGQCDGRHATRSSWSPAARSGIGAALAPALRRGRRGSRGRRRPRRAGRTAVADEIGGVGRGVDVTDAAAVARSSSATLAEHGRIDLFCSNAGITTGIGVEDPRRPVARARSRSTCWRTCTRRAPSCRDARTRARLPAQHRVRRRPAHLARRRAVRGHQARRGRLRRVAAVTYGGRGIGVSVLCPMGVATPLLMDPLGRRRPRRAGGRGVRGDRDARAGRRRGGGRAGRGEVPDPAAPGGRYVLGAEGVRPGPLAGRRAPARQSLIDSVTASEGHADARSAGPRRTRHRRRAGHRRRDRPAARRRRRARSASSTCSRTRRRPSPTRSPRPAARRSASAPTCPSATRCRRPSTRSSASSAACTSWSTTPACCATTCCSR